MLFTRGKIELGGVSYASSVMLEREFRLLTIERRGGIWDTRFTPTANLAAPWPTLSILLDGWVRFHGPGAPTVRAPMAVASATPPLEGPIGETRLTLTSGGEPFSAVQLTVAPAHWARADTQLSAFEPSAELAAAATAAGAAAVDAAVDAARTLLARCADAGLVGPRLGASIVVDEAPAFVRTWDALADSYRTFLSAPTLQEVGVRTGVSERQPARDIDAMLPTFGLAWSGFRKMIGDMRLRWAILLLSSPELPIARIASAAGYGSAAAFGRAMRDAGLPSPIEVRRRVLAEADASRRA